MMKKFILFIFLAVLLGCKRSDETAPVITLTSPADNQVFTGGQTVNVKAMLTDETGLHMVHLSVIDNTTAGHLVHFEEHFDGTTYDLNKTFIPQTGRSYAIHIEATDHADNVTKKDLTVSAN